MSKKTLKELIEELQLKPSQVLDLMRQGFKLDKETTTESITEAMGRISDMLMTPVPTDLDKILSDVEDVHLIFIKDDINNVVYATIAYRGKIWRTETDGKLNHDHRTGDLDEVIDAFVQAGMPPKPEEAKRTRKPSSRPAPRPENRSKRTSPTYIYDPHLLEYLKKNARLIVDEMCRVQGKGNGNGKRQITNSADLERILPSEYLARSGRLGLSVYAQNRVNFCRDNASRFKTRRDVFLNKLLDDAEIASIIETFFTQKFTKNEHVDLPTLETYVNSARNAKDVYSWFSNNRTTRSGPDAVIGALRERLMHIYGKGRRAELSKTAIERLDNISQRTLSWVSVANACENVKDDEHVQREVIPYFKTVREQAVDPERERYQLSDAIYNGLAQLASKVVDPKDTFTLNQFKFTLTGLWYLGYLLTDHGWAEDVDYLDATVRERSLEAATGQFLRPLSHLVQRYSVYDPVLKKAFKSLCLKGHVDDIKLTTQRDCHALGVQLYQEIHPKPPTKITDTVFTYLDEKGKKGILLSPLDDQESHLARILKIYVAANRAQLLEGAHGKH